MKKLISMTLVAAMALTMGACGAKKDEGASGTANSEAVSSEAASSETSSNETASSEAVSAEDASSEASAENAESSKVGVLTMLNMTEEEMTQFRMLGKYVSRILLDEGYIESNSKALRGEKEVVFYDTLDSMLMALNVGDIDELMIYNKTGQYLCATNDNLQLAYSVNLDKELNSFAYLLFNGHMRNDFAFLMMEENEALRDEFSNAINDMKGDGTLDNLISEQIDALINGGDVKPVTMPTIDGAETVKVAVTGALPPMDYVAEDGSPAGFNTAVLAEISQRIGKNIELVVVDSIGRATALSSGTVDAVFWTRTNQTSSKYQEFSDEKRASRLEELESKMSDEEVEAFNKVKEALDFENYNKVDMPEGTICTVPYYSDIIVAVARKD